MLSRRASMLALVLSAVSFTACRTEPRVMQVELTVDGMTCDSCVQAITYELGRVEGVRKVVVDLEGGKAVVTFTEGQIDPAAIEQVIETIGYEATPGATVVVAEP